MWPFHRNLLKICPPSKWKHLRGGCSPWFTIYFQSLSNECLVNRKDLSLSFLLLETSLHLTSENSSYREQSQTKLNSTDSWKGRSSSASAIGTFILWWKLIAFERQFLWSAQQYTHVHSEPPFVTENNGNTWAQWMKRSILFYWKESSGDTG